LTFHSSETGEENAAFVFQQDITDGISKTSHRKQNKTKIEKE
jgi:hypothetical protein